MFKDRLDGYQALELSMKCAADWMKPNSQRKFRAARTPTNAEVREHLGARLNRTQRLLDRFENGETLDQRAQQQAYLSQQGERKALGKSLEEGCDHQTAREDRERPIGNEGPPGQRSAVGRACSRSELCRKT